MMSAVVMAIFLFRIFGAMNKPDRILEICGFSLLLLSSQAVCCVFREGAVSVLVMLIVFPCLCFRVLVIALFSVVLLAPNLQKSGLMVD
jgi:hypothetical protein